MLPFSSECRNETLPSLQGDITFGIKLVLLFRTHWFLFTTLNKYVCIIRPDVRFTAGSRRVRLEGADNLDASVATPGSGVFLYVKIAQQGATRQMVLTGRLLLANVLRFNLLFKVNVAKFIY